MVLQQERLFASVLAGNNVVEPIVFSNKSFQGSGRGRFGGHFGGRNGYGGCGHERSRPMCTYCGQARHLVYKCYKKYGYPIGYRAPQINVVDT